MGSVPSYKGATGLASSLPCEETARSQPSVNQEMGTQQEPNYAVLLQKEKAHMHGKMILTKVIIVISVKAKMIIEQELFQ